MPQRQARYSAHEGPSVALLLRAAAGDPLHVEHKYDLYLNCS